MLSLNIDVAESKDAIDVTAELPGVDEKDVDVTLANGMLTVRGEKDRARRTRQRQELACGGAQLWVVQQNNTSTV